MRRRLFDILLGAVAMVGIWLAFAVAMLLILFAWIVCGATFVLNDLSLKRRRRRLDHANRREAA